MGREAAWAILLMGPSAWRGTATTISYTLKVTNSHFGGFSKLLFCWKGSIYKLLYKEFIVFMVLYAVLSLIYWQLLTKEQKRLYTEVAQYCNRSMDLTPVLFVLRKGHLTYKRWLSCPLPPAPRAGKSWGHSHLRPWGGQLKGKHNMCFISWPQRNLSPLETWHLSCRGLVPTSTRHPVTPSPHPGLSLGAGFYVTLIVNRWWAQYTSIPLPDQLMCVISSNVHGKDEKGRILRRTLIRCANLSSVLILRSVSTRVLKRFPSITFSWGQPHPKALPPPAMMLPVPNHLPSNPPVQKQDIVRSFTTQP
ncbi:bestrophin-4-like [Alca torda]